jgi:hypothetical protein
MLPSLPETKPGEMPVLPQKCKNNQFAVTVNIVKDSFVLTRKEGGGGKGCFLLLRLTKQRIAINTPSKVIFVCVIHIKLFGKNFEIMFSD